MDDSSCNTDSFGCNCPHPAEAHVSTIQECGGLPLADEGHGVQLYSETGVRPEPGYSSQTRRCRPAPILAHITASVQHTIACRPAAHHVTAHQSNSSLLWHMGLTRVKVESCCTCCWTCCVPVCTLSLIFASCMCDIAQTTYHLGESIGFC